KLVDYVQACWDYSPGLLAWSWIDEPDLYNVEPPTLRNWVELTHANDTIHPVWINMTGYNFTRGENEGWQEEAKKYSYLYNGYLFNGQRTMMADILGFDYYPYEFASKFEWCNLSDYLLALDRLQEWNYNLMPAATFIEVCDQFAADDERLGDRDWTPAPTPAELKNLVWASIIHGAKAINWFQMFVPTPEDNLEVMEEAVTWINDLTSVILAPPGASVEVSDVEQGSGRIDITVREVDDTLYIVAANIISGATETVQFNVEDLPASSVVDVYGESRSIISSAGHFTDMFDALEVHIYVIDLSAPTPTTVQYQVSASGDDTSALSSMNLYTSGVVYTPYSNTDRRAFWRWPITIPAGATITSATLEIKSDGTSGDSNTSTMRVQLIDSDSCPSFTSNPYNSTVTAAYVDWTLPATWTADEWYESSDLSSLVQSFIDRAGYTSGNYLGLRGEQASGLWKRSYQYDNAAANAAVLTITYTGP
ncbi:MAG: hypothetical protein JXL80_06650, partial [Planctomycetes bacterium]|nr:hypothetical protein [Planctomycetota bacterium]